MAATRKHAVAGLQHKARRSGAESEATVPRPHHDDQVTDWNRRESRRRLAGRSTPVALQVQEEPGGGLALAGHLLVHPHPAAVPGPARLDHELRPAAAGGHAGEPPVVDVPHDLHHRAVAQHRRPVAAEVPLDPARLHHLLAVDADRHLAVPGGAAPLLPAARHRDLVLRAVVAEPAPRRVDQLRVRGSGGREGPRPGAADLLAPAEQRAARRRGEAPPELPRALAAAEEERELAVRDDGEVVVAGGLRRARVVVLGLRRVPVDGHRRAGIGGEGPRPALLLQEMLRGGRRSRRRRGRPARRAERRRRRQRQRPGSVVDGHGEPGRAGSSSRRRGGAPGPGDPDPELLARRQRDPVDAGGGRLERAVERGAGSSAAGGPDGQADGAVAEAGEVPHCAAGRFLEQARREGREGVGRRRRERDETTESHARTRVDLGSCQEEAGRVETKRKGAACLWWLSGRSWRRRPGSR
ncbi:hypothetical protein PAHAL_2G130100 [Panicum hallii]|uniref:Uncharacterized protein n=1 Tax=Panicum hallii TaxID=206008 RepID=A0A2S3GXQ2_9POAL|nr:hypothetical protein PAHAL_2G130100 [Panicum hallii]